MQGNQTAVSPPAVRRHGGDSSELDVFDARRYFSGGTDAGVGFRCSTATTTSHHRPITARIFDPPQILETEIKQSTPSKDNKSSKKKFKQPASPGVMLASFFYSFFPTSSKKKNMKEKSSQDVESDERWRRGSRRSSSALTLEAGNRKSKFDQALWKQRYGGETKKTMTRIRNGEEEKRKGDGGLLMENGNESDSSSDLFELKSFDLGAPSFELPVFGSTGSAASFRRRNSSSRSVAF